MESLFKFLEGKKTYIISLVALVLAGLEMFAGIEISDDVYKILGAIGLTTLRDGVAKLKS